MSLVITIFLLAFYSITLASENLDERKTLTCVTTYALATTSTNFSNLLDGFISSWMHTTHVSHLVIVDDGSSSSSHVNYIRKMEDKHLLRIFTVLKEVNGGIAKAKNSCIRYFLTNDMYSYLFLADHDLVFKQEGWLSAYLNAHFSTNISHFSWWNGNSAKCHAVWNNFTLCSSSVTNGALLFLTRDVANAVGGFRVFPGKYGHEHGEFSVRILRAGFAPYFADIVNSHEFISLVSSESVFTASEKDKSASENWQFLGTITANESLKVALVE